VDKLWEIRTQLCTFLSHCFSSADSLASDVLVASLSIIVGYCSVSWY